MVTASLIATSIAVVVAGYLIGSIPFGLLVGRWQRGIDIRRYGSGSTGATNVLRTLGWQASAAVFVADLLKAILPVVLARVLTGSAWVESATGVAVIAGHCWPVYTGFTGGRGATSSLGALLVIQPIVALASFGVFLVVLATTRFASLGSLAGVGFGGVTMAILVATHRVPPGDIIFTIGSPLLVYIRHHENMRRLLAGTERKIGQA
jgi:glycerol-3-phosphate acyltransferase PlsY